MPYNGGASSGSNQGPLNPALLDAVKGRIEALRAADPGNTRAGAGRPRHRLGQRAGPAHQRGRGAVPGRARGQGARHAAEARCATLIERHTEGRWLGLLGEPRVNVLELNLALDGRPQSAEVAGSEAPS